MNRRITGYKSITDYRSITGYNSITEAGLSLAGKSNRVRAAVMLLLAAVCLTFLPIKVHAAEEPKALPKESGVRVAAGETKTISIEYSKVKGGYADLAVLVSDAAIAAVSLQDAGNSTAVLSVQGIGFGSASVAVYVNSNPALVSYVAVYSGLAKKGEVYTVMDGNSLITVYDDRLVYYNSTMTGKNGAVLSVKGIAMERNKGLDCLTVTGDLLSKDSRLPGLNTFYACFYDTGGNLIRRQSVHTQDPVTYQEVSADWYIPQGCTKIVLE